MGLGWCENLLWGQLVANPSANATGQQMEIRLEMANDTCQLQSLGGPDVVIIFQNICVFTTRYLTANPVHTMYHFHTWHTFCVFLINQLLFVCQWRDHLWYLISFYFGELWQISSIYCETKENASPPYKKFSWTRLPGSNSCFEKKEKNYVILFLITNHLEQSKQKIIVQ